MNNIIHTESTSFEDVDLTRVVGRSITAVVLHDPATWWFTVGHESGITVECLWRVLDRGRMVCSSEDHGHRFGLPAPVDSAADATRLLAARPVTAAQLREGTADIAIKWSPHLRLEIISNSRGYESWRIAGPFGVSYVATGNGDFSKWSH